MGKDKEIRSRFVSTPLNATVRGGFFTSMGEGDSREWENFESLLHIPKKADPWFTVSVGEGGWYAVKHGTFPRVDRPIPATKALEPLVGTGWRGVHCSYWVDTIRAELCLQVLGEVSGLFEGSQRRNDWPKTLLLKSWLAMAHVWFSCLDWGEVLYRPTVAIAAGESSGDS